jgi:Protein of unknown function (DUF3606)
MTIMADDKTKTRKADRSRVAGSEGYEVSYFAQKHGITMGQARERFARIGTIAPSSIRRPSS